MVLTSRISKIIVLLICAGVCNAQNEKNSPIGGQKNDGKPLVESSSDKTLLWQVSGNGLDRPSFLYGTIHMLCAEDAILSESLKNAIARSDQVYLEVDMDNLFEMLGTLKNMKMRGDTTLSDLLSKKDYEKVKHYFEEKSSLLPFSMLETYKPFLAAATIMESNIECESVPMEQVIMQEAKKNRKNIKGLETMSYQMSIFDSIPYKSQAEQLVQYIDHAGDEANNKEYDDLVSAYKKQDLQKLEELTKQTDMGMANYVDMLLYNRNRNWVKKLKTLMQEKSLVVAVGAGHLPGENGVINLLRKAGYTVTPLQNKIRKSSEI
jgi:uncharacterized protein YbaP (TraB family)